MRLIPGLDVNPAIDRLMGRLAERDGCWIVQGIAPHRYGSVKVYRDRQGSIDAHRLMFEYFRCEIPEGLELDHLCRTRPCCNPWHLEPVSHWENVLRGEQAQRTHCKRAGHELTPENTYWQYMPHRRGQMCRSCVKCRREAVRRHAERKRAAEQAAK